MLALNNACDLVANRVRGAQILFHTATLLCRGCERLACPFLSLPLPSICLKYSAMKRKWEFQVLLIYWIIIF
jgi:hypothetical protein